MSDIFKMSVPLKDKMKIHTYCIYKTKAVDSLKKHESNSDYEYD